MGTWSALLSLTQIIVVTEWDWWYSPSNEATAHRYPQFSRNINIDRSLQVSIRTIGQNWSIRRLRIVLSFWGEIWDRIDESTGFEWFWMNFSVLRVIFRTGPAKINSIYAHKSLSWRENSFRPHWMLWCRLFIDLSKLCNKINQQMFYFNKKSDPDRNDGTISWTTLAHPSDMTPLIRSLKNMFFDESIIFWIWNEVGEAVPTSFVSAAELETCARQCHQWIRTTRVREAVSTWWIRVSRVRSLCQTVSPMNSYHSSSGSCVNLMNSCQPS